MNLAPMTARLPTRPDVTPFPDSLDDMEQVGPFVERLLVVVFRQFLVLVSRATVTVPLTFLSHWQPLRNEDAHTALVFGFLRHADPEYGLGPWLTSVLQRERPVTAAPL